jgi:hypothetical protein
MTDHKWRAIAMYELTEEEARRVGTSRAELVPADPPIDLGLSNLQGIEAGCWVCEQELTLALIGTDCPGEP